MKGHIGNKQIVKQGLMVLKQIFCKSSDVYDLVEK